MRELDPGRHLDDQRNTSGAEGLRKLRTELRGDLITRGCVAGFEEGERERVLQDLDTPGHPHPLPVKLLEPKTES